MPIPRIENLRIAGRPERPLRNRAWREWCFFRMVVRHFRRRLLITAAIVALGAILLNRLDPGPTHSPVRALYVTWQLVFGQSSEELPVHPLLRLIFFVMPVIGLTVIIHAIVDFSEMVRDRRRNERSWCKMMSSSLSNHIILVGMGKLGYRIFTLLRKLGETVVVIERNEHRQFLDEVRRAGCPLLVGDARDEALLVDANIAAARSVVLCTNDDLANLEVALDARRIAPKIRVVLRMFDQNMADKIRHGFNIHIAMSQSAMSAPAFALAAVDRALTNGFVIDDQLVVMRRTPVEAGGPLAGLSVADVLTRLGFSIIHHAPSSGQATTFPKLQTILRPGDEVLLQGPFDRLAVLGSAPAPT